MKDKKLLLESFHSEDIDVDGRMIMDLKGEKWIHLAWDRKRWRTVVSVVISHRLS
jgi:hypothetical protein